MNLEGRRDHQEEEASGRIIAGGDGGKNHPAEAKAAEPTSSAEVASSSISDGQKEDSESRDGPLGVLWRMINEDSETTTGLDADDMNEL